MDPLQVNCSIQVLLIYILNASTKKRTLDWGRNQWLGWGMTEHPAQHTSGDNVLITSALWPHAFHLIYKKKKKKVRFCNITGSTLLSM